ncbi:hypothetical protein ACQPZF_35780 [Actinosynnema sp. CS-041913]|uniref:hypothetical protein n=1 Tax=Actinosynnema sp. CS-041913 TaxID=3239917 RepID=UPI003D94F5D7
MIMGAVVGLTFLFGFGNVLNLAIRLGVPVWVAPLVAPAVDLTVLGLMLGIRHLAFSGATVAQLRPARRLLMFASLVTMALNVAEPVAAGQYGKAAFDAVGPLLLIGWAEVGPGLLQAMAESCGKSTGLPVDRVVHMGIDGRADTVGSCTERPASSGQGKPIDDDLLERARQEDARHWKQHRRPISAEKLRKRLGVGARRSRILVSIIRTGRDGTSRLHAVPAG